MKNKQTQLSIFSIISNLLSKDKYFFGLLFACILLLFRNAFTTNFFLDDFFFIHISHAQNIGQFLHFFDPIRSYSYKPLATEVYYFLLSLVHYNLFIAHAIVFATYFVGLYYLYKCLFFISKNELFSKLAVFVYAFSFVHVFQLYYLGTYQEVAVLTFLVLSFYTYLQRKFKTSLLFFFLALFCKENAILFLPFLFVFEIALQKKEKNTTKIKRLALYLPFTILFLLLYEVGLSHVTQLANYKPHLSIKLIFNTFMWYLLWGIGFPNFMPDYVSHIFSKPLPAFWTLFQDNQIKDYFISLATYLVLIIISFVTFFVEDKKNRKLFLLLLLLAFICFGIFIFPYIFIIHKWMVRLTLSLIFISLVIGYVMTQLLHKNTISRLVAAITIISYVIFNLYGISVHEKSSTYMLETSIVDRADTYFKIHKPEIITHKYIYFQDPANQRPNPYAGSQKLLVTLHDQDFLNYYFPGYRLKAIYGFRTQQIPQGAYLVNAADLAPYATFNP